MMEINLLNRAGAHLKEDSHFDNVDENLISEISLDFKKDFESIHEIKKAKIGTGKKRIFVYLFSSGHEEYRYLLGRWAVWIYHAMYKIVTSGSKVIICHERLHDKEKSHFIQRTI